MKVFLINTIEFDFSKLNINQFLEHFLATLKPRNKLIEIDSQNQIWNNAVYKDDIEKTFRDQISKRLQGLSWKKTKILFQWTMFVWGGE